MDVRDDDPEILESGRIRVPRVGIQVVLVVDDVPKGSQWDLEERTRKFFKGLEVVPI